METAVLLTHLLLSLKQRSGIKDPAEAMGKVSSSNCELEDSDTKEKSARKIKAQTFKMSRFSLLHVPNKTI